jgi:hypothetical protein
VWVCCVACCVLECSFHCVAVFQVQRSGERGVANAPRASGTRMPFPRDAKADVLTTDRKRMPPKKKIMLTCSPSLHATDVHAEGDLAHSVLISGPTIGSMGDTQPKARAALPYVTFAAVAGLLFGYDMCIIGCT